MKKSLIALAVFGAFSGAAMADGSSVQLYGIIDVGVTHFTGLAPSNGVNGTQTVSSTGLSSGVMNGSRIGLKGTEDLGGGVSALFDVETGFCAAGTNQDKPGQTYCTGGGFMGRQSYVGVTGNFGTVVGGKMYTPAFNADAAMDPFGMGLTGNFGNIDLVAHNGVVRANQTVAYVTPNLSGFTGTAAYSFAPADASSTVPSSTNSNITRAWVLQGQYGNGPITAGADYTKVTNVTGVNLDGALKLWQVYGGYDFGVAKVTALYEKATKDYYTGSSNAWLLGATVPVGPGAILASYAQTTSDLSATTAITASKAKQYAIGYTYALSKRTSLYTSYAHISNDSAAGTATGTAFAVGTATDGFSGVTGQSSSGFALGVKHSF